MIKANELRIGNWVMLAGTYWQIGFAKEIDVHHFEPIELTPEILEKIKFSGMIFPAQLSVSNTGKYYWGNVVDIEIKHLHQLQNLYFALTGTELEINLNP